MTNRTRAAVARVWVFRAGLLAASTLVPATAQAQESVEARLDRLEALLTALEARLDASEGAAPAQPVPEAGAEALSQMRAVMAETRVLAEQQEALERRLTANETADQRGFRMGGTTITMGGYVKLDAISVRTSGGSLPTSAITRDFLIPVAIPVGGAPSGWDTDFNARDTRFSFATSTPVGDKTIGTNIELDFMVTEAGDERVANSYLPRVRLAYITYDGWLFGQTWSTFQNVGALPDSVDFIGVTPGTVFSRQPLIRYTRGGLSVALEQPETTLTGASGERLLPGDDMLPDMVVRYDHKGLSIAAIARQLRGSETGLSDTASTWGYGLSVAGKIPLGERNDFRFMATAGDGLGRYIGVNIVNDAAIGTDGRLDAITTYSGYAAFRHVWRGNLRSTAAASWFKADNPVALTGLSPTDTAWNAFANLIYTPAPRFDLGLEYMYAERELESGLSGNLQKVQLSAKYSF